MDVVLVVMPFADVSRPGLGVSLLKAAAEAAGFSAQVEYLNIELSERIGLDLYVSVADDHPADLLLGEWLFAADLFGDEIPPARDYVAHILPYASPAAVEDLLDARAKVAAYLDDAAGRIAALRPAVVGFTSTFHQTCPSLAVARRLKAMADPPVVVFGGANCEGEMGAQLAASFPEIDLVCSGESDVSFVALLRRLLRGEEVEVPGLVDATGAQAPPCPVDDLDALPHPDFDDYFERLEGSPAAAGAPRQVVVETARGCWWGARRHCTFCGLNGQTLAFRSKTPARAYDEITALCRRYGSTQVSCVDNILDPRYVDTLFPRLAEADLGLELFYEVKANLHHDQLVKLHAGGVRHIQPGIESLSDEVLRIMRKGVTGFQNLQLLRWCAEVGIGCSWNILAGFPGETPAEYEWMGRMAPFLHHLQPPVSCSPIRLDRFSPLFDRAAESGLTRVRPARAYYYVYPLGRQELRRLAYFFDFDYADGHTVDSYVQPLTAVIGEWWAAWGGDDRPVLDARIDGGTVVVTDSRAVATAATHELTAARAAVLLHCDQRATATTMARSPELAAFGDDLDDAVDELEAAGLLARRGGRLVSLPVFRDRPADHPLLRTRTDDARVDVPLPTPSARPLLRLGRPA